MTTKFLDNKICTFKILLSLRFPRKTAFLDNSPLDPRARPPPKKRKFYFYCRLAVSENPQTWNREWGGFQEGGFQIVERAAFSSRGNLLLQRNSYLK